MNRANCILVFILLVTAGCEGNKQTGDDFITVDVTKSYPKKELILQDFMDVEYVALETTDEFLCQDQVQAIGKDFIVVKNRVMDGDIFIFSRNGKVLRKFNRWGQGHEEYTFPSRIILDEDNDEIIVDDKQIKKIIVYDLFGNFKRSFLYNKGSIYTNIYNFGREKLILADDAFDYSEYFETHDRPRFSIISKQDGSVVNDIEISFIQKKTRTLRQGNTLALINNILIRPFQDSFILTELSSDTVFRYLPDNSMVPFIIRTPSIQSIGTETFLIPSTLTDRYYFMTTVKKEYDFNRRDADFPTTHLVYDRQEKTTYKCIALYNDDFTDKRTENMIRMDYVALNNEIAYYQSFQAYELIEALEKGQLKGKLKEIAAGLKEEDNPVIMLVKHKR